MRVLILGGTLFLGRQLVTAALARGHDVTLFHRGQTNPGLFTQVEHRHGDRDGGLEALEGGRWDVAIDTSGYLPRVVRASARLLAGAIEHMTFVSSISVYAEPMFAPVRETNAVATLDDPSSETLNGASYGALKALCERAVDEEMPGRTLHVRPGLIVGPYDSTDRFPYWPRRMARGGDVLAPGEAGAPVQLIDVRDLAAWMIARAEVRTTGMFNLTGPRGTLTMGDALDACRTKAAVDGAANADHLPARLVWMDEAFLLEHGVTPWTELPLWVPAADAALQQVDCSRAFATGLLCRPLAETARDTLAWDRATPPDARPVKPGVRMPGPITAQREQELLAAWAARPR